MDNELQKGPIEDVNKKKATTTKTAGEWLGELDLLLKRINGKTDFLQRYAAVSDSSKVDIASTVDSLKVNLANARTKVESEYTSLNDLITRFLRIRTALDRHNVEKIINVDGVEITIATGMAMIKHIVPVYDKANRAVDYAIRSAKQDVNSVNQRLTSTSEKAKDIALAEVLIFVKPKDKEDLATKASELSMQIRNAIKYANNSTFITVED